MNGSNLLPSAYFELNVKSGKAVQIQGKGYGHGVGMSQNGANEMAREGYGWQDILNYFFKDITLEVVGNNLTKFTENPRIKFAQQTLLFVLVTGRFVFLCIAKRLLIME